MPDIGRRGFLGGAGLLASVVAGCRPGRDPYTAQKPSVPVEPGLRPGSEKFVSTTCGLCQAGCGLRVRVVDGRAVKVEGSPESSVNRGGLCVRGQAGLEVLYHPDRIRGPRRRVGERGQNRWQELSWDEAIAELAAELNKLRAAGAPQSLVVLDGERTGTTHALWARLLETFGSPNHIGHGATGVGAMARAVRRLTRKTSLPAYDFESARCVLLVGTGTLESSPHFIHLARALAGEARPRLLCAASRLPPMASVVDEWLSLAPGGSAPLLLGLLHVLLREQLGDESVLEGASGFLPWADRAGTRHGGLREQVLSDFSPDRVEAWTGIPAARIAELARELVAVRQSVVVVDEGTCDPATAFAALLVNALVGALDVPGGMRLDPAVPLADFGATDLDEVARMGLRSPPVDGRAPGQSDFQASRLLGLPEAILSGKPYATKVLLLSYSNPAYSKPDPQRWHEAIANVPFVVSFSPVLDESVLSADLLLPDHTFFERWDVVVPEGSAGVLSLRQPVVRPLANTLQTGEVLLRLARALGPTVARAFPWPDYQGAVQAGLGNVEGGAEAVLSALESAGQWGLDPAKPEGSDPDGERPLTRLFDVRETLSSVPAPTVGDPVRFPFVLLPVRGPGYAEGGRRYLPWLCELPTRSGDPRKERVEISLEDARRLGIEDGDAVIVESPAAQIEMWAEVRADIRPGALAVPLGGGPGPAYAAAPGAASLLVGLADATSGHWFAYATRAQVRKGA